MSKLLDDLKRATAARQALENACASTDNGHPAIVTPDIGTRRAEGARASRPNAWMVGAWTAVALALGIALGSTLRSPPPLAPQPAAMRPITKSDDGPRPHLRMETSLDRAASEPPASRD